MLSKLPSGTPSPLPTLEFATLDSIYKETSGFGNITVHIIPQFDIQAGGRYSKNEQVATESLSGVARSIPRLQHALVGTCVDVFCGAALAHRRG